MSEQSPVRDSVTGEPVEPVTPVSPYAREPVPTYLRVMRLVWFVAAVIDVLVGLRFVLKLFAASAASPFVALIYGVSAPLVAPFRGIFPVAGESGFVTTLIKRVLTFCKLISNLLSNTPKGTAEKD